MVERYHKDIRKEERSKQRHGHGVNYGQSVKFSPRADLIALMDEKIKKKSKGSYLVFRLIMYDRNIL